MLNMVAERLGVQVIPFGRSMDDANHGGNAFEFIPLHVVTKKLQSIKSDERFHDFFSE